MNARVSRLAARSLARATRTRALSTAVAEELEYEPEPGPPFEDAPLGLTREPTTDEYNARRAIIEVYSGVGHMANVFAIVRHLERAYGRVEHFYAMRSADVDEEYRGAVFVTFKHLKSAELLDKGANLPQPREMIWFRPGGVGLDELTGVLPRIPAELGEQVSLLGEEDEPEQVEAASTAPEQQNATATTTETNVENTTSSDEAQLNTISTEDKEQTVPPTNQEQQDTVASKPTTTESPASDQDANTNGKVDIDRHLPHIYLRMMRYKMPQRPARQNEQFVNVRPTAGQTVAIGRALGTFHGFASNAESNARMADVLHKWAPFIPKARLLNDEPTEPELEPEPEPEPAIEPVVMQPPAWKPPPPRESPALVAAKAVEEVKMKFHSELQQVKSATQTKQQAQASRHQAEAQRRAEAARVARLANRRASQQQQEQQQRKPVSHLNEPAPATKKGAFGLKTVETSDEGQSTQSTATQQAMEEAQPSPGEAADESKARVWKTLSSRLGSFMGIGGKR